MGLKKYRWRRMLRLVGPVVFIYIFLKIIDPAATADLLVRINYSFALFSIILIPIVNLLITHRWWVICKRLNLKASLNQLYQIYYISWFLSALPFIGVAPVSKLLYLKNEKNSLSSSAISILVDKLCDIVGLLFFGLFALFYFSQIMPQDLQAWLFGIAGLFIVIPLTAVSKKSRLILKKLTNKYVSKKFGDAVENDLALFINGINLRFVTYIIFISTAIGLARSSVLYILSASLSIHVSFWMIVACRALIGIVNIIPVSINGIGTRDAVLLLCLPLAGISQESAIALGLLAFLWALLSKLTGVIFWLKRPTPSESRDFSRQDSCQN